jgi:hypothetical protein
MSPKRRLAFTGLHNVISQKTEFFKVTGVRTSNPKFVLRDSLHYNATSSLLGSERIVVYLTTPSIFSRSICDYRRGFR